MSDFIIERVDGHNLPKLADEMYMDTLYQKRVQEMMSRDDMAVFAVVYEGRYVGRCSLWLAPTDEPEPREEIPGVPYVNALEVHPEFYRRGIASMLITALEQEAMKRGKTQLALGVEPQNGPGKALYEKLGFKYRKILGRNTYPCFWLETLPDGTEKTNSIEALLMVKDL